MGKLIAGVLAALPTVAEMAPEDVGRTGAAPLRAIDATTCDVGYPRVIGYYPGTGIYGDSGVGYVMGPGGVGAALPGNAMHVPGQPAPMLLQPPAPQPIAFNTPPWRPMMAPGSPPLGEGHVGMPLSPESFGGMWGGAAGATAGASIVFSARPQKPFKTTRLLISATKAGATAIGRLVGQIFVGTDLQQGELGNMDLESLGAGGSFDTWLSLKQAEPGVWIRVQATLTAFPNTSDFETYVITAIGHYLH